MNELNKHKKSDKIKWTFTGIAFVLVFVMLAGVCLQVFGKDKWKPTEWFEKTDMEQPTPEIPDDTKSEVSPTVSLFMGTANVMSLSSETESAYVSRTVTATISPSTVVDKYVTRSIAWASDAALKNTDISDYVQNHERSARQSYRNAQLL